MSKEFKFMILFLLLGSIIGYAGNEIIRNSYSEKITIKENPAASLIIPETEADIEIDCKNLSNALMTSQCLHDELSQWWTYNISNIDLFWNNGKPNIVWDIIKEQGGVCWQSAEWYVQRAKELGLYATRIDFEIPALNHSVGIIVDDYGNYCIVDQTQNPLCGKVIGVKNETE